MREAFILGALLLVACGGTGSTGGSSQGTGGMSSASSSATGAGGHASSSSASSSSASSSSSGGGQGALVPSLVGMSLYIDCMPVVSTDPIHGSFEASYDNSAGKAADAATIKSASLAIKGANSMDTWAFTATPSQSGSVAAGATTKVMHTKDMGSGKGTGSPCQHCMDNWTLTVAWDVDGKTVMDQVGPMQVSCVF